MGLLGPVAMALVACGTTPPPVGTSGAANDTRSRPAETASASAISGPATTLPTRPRVTHVLLAGDSVARGEAPALQAAITAAGIAFSSIAFDGAGIMAAPDDSLEAYRDALALVTPDLVVYQLSLWDRGTPAEQEAAYRAFAALVTGTGAQLVFVTIPPLERQDEHLDVRSLEPIAAALAAEQPTTVHLLDAAEVWGTVYTRDIGGDGSADRMKDGVHICQSGAMRFAAWLIAALAARFDGMAVPRPEDWVFGTWNASTAYDVPADACDPLTGS